MKTRTSKLAAIFTSVALAATMLASCGGSSDKITVISREDGSGTRGAFIELTGIEEKTLTATRPITQRKMPLSVSQQTLCLLRCQEIRTLSATFHSAH